jgi:predicted lipoprotein with Yx(FWY)xxD motif
VKRSHIIIVLAIAITSLVVGVTAASAAIKSAGVATVKVGSSSPGRILVDARGRTLYLFEKDTRVTAPA